MGIALKELDDFRRVLAPFWALVCLKKHDQKSAADAVEIMRQAIEQKVKPIDAEAAARLAREYATRILKLAEIERR